ncbi:hypothetical protein Tco_0797739 [Tanacetum coccineum]
MGTVSDVITGGTEGAVQQGPVRARVLNDLSAEEKERYKADIRATNILLQGIPEGHNSLINHYTDANRHLGKHEDGFWKVLVSQRMTGNLSYTLNSNILVKSRRNHSKILR